MQLRNGVADAVARDRRNSPWANDAVQHGICPERPTEILVIFGRRRGCALFLH
jgi:hypothetical protein